MQHHRELLTSVHAIPSESPESKTIQFHGEFLTHVHYVPSENPALGSAAAFKTPNDVVVEADGNLVVGDVGLQAVVRVDPLTGDRTIMGITATIFLPFVTQ